MMPIEKINVSSLRLLPWTLMPTLATRPLLGEMADEMLLASSCVLPRRLSAVDFLFRHPTLEVAVNLLLGRSSTAAPGNG